MLFALPFLPLLVGLGVAVCGPLLRSRGERALRRLLALGAGGVLAGAFAIAIWGAATLPRGAISWGPGLELALAVTPIVRVASLLVPAVAAPVVLWATAHEDAEGLCRLVGGLLAFAGAMELLVLAADLLVLLIGWELVGGLSFLLIGHHHGDDQAVASASYAFNATRIGGLGLLVAAGAAFAATGSFAFEALDRTVRSPFAQLFAAGVFCAAASKSAQLPFSPWLMRAMAGPSSASALLHSSTMVAAGAWLLIRLHQPLESIPWFGPLALAIGLGTAIVGGISAAAQEHAKRLLAASTSAQYGLMFAAAGAGAAGAALAHLVTHAFFKALLFLAAGTAISAAGTPSLGRMGLGRRLPVVAAASAVGALALAAVPPLGAAWSKEMVVAATARVSTPLALLTLLAGGLSAFYAARFQLLAFGRAGGAGASASEPRREDAGATAVERSALLLLALGCVALSALWLPGIRAAAVSWASVRLPEGAVWELPVSFGVVLLGLGGAWRCSSAGQLRDAVRGPRALVSDWLGLPALIDRALVLPVLALAGACARFEDRIADAALQGSARLGQQLAGALGRLVEPRFDVTVKALARATLRLGDASRRIDREGIDGCIQRLARAVGAGGRWARRSQTGALPFYYALAVGGLLFMGLLLWFGRYAG